MKTPSVETEAVEKIIRATAPLMYWPLLPVLPVAAGIVHLVTWPKSWSPAKKTVLAVAGAAVGLNLIHWQLQRFTSPKPHYEVVQHDGLFEVRRYPALVVAQTRVNSGFDAAIDEGFSRLAAFIFGKNAQREHVAMTSPVVTQHDVFATEENDRGYTVSFVMPQDRSVGDLPIPDDDRVTLREFKPRTVAALKFRGRYDWERVKQVAARLLEETREHGLEAQGEPAFAGYDSPSTLPLLRRNEVWIEVAV
jgi:effector-binding domain-containing protein